VFPVIITNTALEEVMEIVMLTDLDLLKRNLALSLFFFSIT